MKEEEKRAVETSTGADGKQQKQASRPSSAPSNVRVSTSPAHQARRPKPQPVKNPAKIGKANPARDIPIFLGILGFLFLLSWAFSGIGGAKEIDKKKSVKQIQNDLRKSFEEAQALENARKRTMECDLFLAYSSIPEAKLGIFAGKRYEVGDEVIHPGVFYPVDGEQHEVEGKTAFVSQYGFLLKHHPLLANLRGGPIWSDDNDFVKSPVANLRADRVIEAGDELFVSYENHPQKHFGIFSYPTLEDYALADEIIHDEIRTQRRGAATRKVGKMSAGGGGALMMVKRAVEKFNKNVAALLPGSEKALGLRDGLQSCCALSALTNRTVHYLEIKGQCLDDVFIKPSGTSSSENEIYAKRHIKKHGVVVPVPLFARRRDESCSANATLDKHPFDEHCFSHKDSSLLLCSLSSVVFAQISSGGEGSTANVNSALKWNSGSNVKVVQKCCTVLSSVPLRITLQP